MQAYKYIILPLLLIGSASSLLVGNTDSDRVKPTFFDRITERVANSRLFNRINIDKVLPKVIRGLDRITTGLLVVVACDIAYTVVKSFNQIRKDIKQREQAMLEAKLRQQVREEVREQMRIATLKKEQESYWYRISNFFLKK